MSIMRKPARSFLLSDLAIAVAVVIGIPALLLYNGFGVCAKPRGSHPPHYKIGFLSDEEAIDAAIDEAMTRSLHVTETPTGGYARFIPKNQIRYRDREEFRRLNPDCCRIVPHDDIFMHWSHEVRGLANKSVHVSYAVRYMDEDGRQSSEAAVAQRVITNCGRVARFD
jgi:hypothetical protein